MSLSMLYEDIQDEFVVPPERVKRVSGLYAWVGIEKGGNEAYLTEPAVLADGRTVGVLLAAPTLAEAMLLERRAYAIKAASQRAIDAFDHVEVRPFPTQGFVPRL